MLRSDRPESCFLLFTHIFIIYTPIYDMFKIELMTIVNIILCIEIMVM